MTLGSPGQSKTDENDQTTLGMILSMIPGSVTDLILGSVIIFLMIIIICLAVWLKIVQRGNLAAFSPVFWVVFFNRWEIPLSYMNCFCPLALTKEKSGHQTEVATTFVISIQILSHLNLVRRVTGTVLSCSLRTKRWPTLQCLSVRRKNVLQQRDETWISSIQTSDITWWLKLKAAVRKLVAAPAAITIKILLRVVAPPP